MIATAGIKPEPSWAAGLLSWLWRFLFQAEIVEQRTISMLAGRSVELPGSFLGAASELEIAFTLRWPLFSSREKQRVKVEILPPPRAGQCSIEQTPGWRRTHLRVRMRGLEGELGGKLQLQCHDERRGRWLGVVEVSRLAEPEAQRLRVQRLKVLTRHVYVRSGPHRHRSDSVPETSDYVEPELTVSDDGLGAFLAPLATTLGVGLASGGSGRLLVEQPVTLTGQTQTFTCPAISLKDQELFPHTGAFCLIATLDGKELARFPFRVVTVREVLQQVRIGKIHIAARRRNGQTARGVKVLRWEEHEAIIPWIQLKAGIIAPATKVQCAVRILQGRKVLRSEQLLLSLERGSQLVRLQQMELEKLGLEARSRPTRLTIAVQAGEERSAASPLVVLPPERLTNFEGQLNLEARNLPFDETEYEQIVRHLGVLNGSLPRRWFGWRFFRRRPKHGPVDC